MTTLCQTSGIVSTVTSVNYKTGAVKLTTADIPERMNLYFTEYRGILAARAALSGTDPITFDSSTGAIGIVQTHITSLTNSIGEGILFIGNNGILSVAEPDVDYPTIDYLTETLVPYEGAAYDLNLGENALIFGATGTTPSTPGAGEVAIYAKTTAVGSTGSVEIACYLMDQFGREVIISSILA